MPRVRVSSLLRTAGAFALAALAALPAASHATPPPPAGTLETLALFNPAALETPESVILDSAGNIFLSLALTGEIRKIAPDGTQSTLAFLPLGGAPLTPCFGFFDIQGALALGDHGEIFVSVASCDLAQRGIWKVSASGATSLVANLPGSALPNGIALFHDKVYVADSAQPRIWRAPQSGGAAEVWIEDPLLATPPGSPFPGANGLQVFHHEIYVSVSGSGQIVAIPFRHGDDAGTPRVHAQLPPPLGCDDFAFDVHGALYCGTDPFNRLVKVNPDGTSEVLLTFADGLDGPTTVAFGVRGGDRENLYIGNAAFPFFTTTFRPSLMRYRLGIPGAPRGH
jgi:sugar lactone lactonase YvrE